LEGRGDGGYKRMCDRYWKGGVMEGIKGCDRYWKGGVMEGIKGCDRY
jgi:hypothetical protein